MKGSYFYKADLHIHTPSSKCYLDKGVTADEIIDKALQQGLKIIAITDHNDISFIDEVRKSSKQKDIVVFPGIEITTTNAHILAIFDPKFPIQRLGDLLVTVGIPSDKRGMRDAIGKDTELVIKEIADFGGIAIASHANSSNGLFKHPRGTYKLNICKMSELMALEFADKDDVEKFCSGAIPQYPAKACVMCSDAHSLSEIGQRFVYLKMDTISIESLKLALLDYEVKTKFPWDEITPEIPMIKKLYVSQGFFENQPFDFHPNLNCLVGGRGTGKSTVIELMRYCFDDISIIKEIRGDTLGKISNLVGIEGYIQVEYHEGGEDYTVQRIVTDPITSSQSEIINKDDELAYIFNKPIFFSQGEIARIATSPIAQLDLLDKYIDLSSENKEEQDIIQALKTNRTLLYSEISAFDDLMSEVLDQQNGKLATKAEHDRLERELKNPIFVEFPRWELEGRFLDNRESGLKSIEEAVIGYFNSINVMQYFHVSIDDTSPNYERFIKPANEIPQQINAQLTIIKKYFLNEMDKFKLSVKAIRDGWQPFFDIKTKEYDDFLEKLGEANLLQAQKRYRILKARIEELNQKEKQALLHKKEKARLEKERERLLKRLAYVRTNKFQKRLAKAKEWEDKCSGEIKIVLNKSGDRSVYLAKLKSLLYGRRIYEKDMQTIVQTIEPEQLVEACLNKQIDWLCLQSMVREDIITKIVDFLTTRDFEDVYDLQIVQLEDSILISFEVEPGNYKPINELSVGTKSTVIVSLAMIEGTNPLVIDQPEDSLDTEFIYNQIVKKLRKEKSSRQFIFTTHNANILVAGDAEMSHILSASADKGYIKSSGGIDRLDTNQLVLLHLEGGHEAFQLRSQKYLK